MEDDLLTQLTNICTPEMAVLYIKAMDLFDEIGTTSHVDTIEQHLGITDYQSGNEYNNMIRDTIERQLTYELGKFTILLNPDVPYDMAFTIELLRAMYHIDIYPDGESMLAALQSDDTDVREALFRVLKIVNPMDEDEFFIQVRSVSPALLTRLKSTREVLPEAVTDKDDELHAFIRERAVTTLEGLKGNYSEFEGEVTSEVILHIENTRLGYDLQPALALLSVRIFQQDIIEAICDLALLCAGSNISKPSEAFGVLLDYYVEDYSNRRVLPLIAECKALLSLRDNDG